MKHSEGFLKLVEDAKTRVREVSIEKLKAKRKRGEDFDLLDVREDHEWAQGRLPGARHLGKGVIERDIEGVCPDKSRELVLYCGGGFRSALAADSLQQMGYRNVLSLAGGIRAWREAGAPLTS